MEGSLSWIGSTITAPELLSEALKLAVPVRTPVCCGPCRPGASTMGPTSVPLSAPLNSTIDPSELGVTSTPALPIWLSSRSAAWMLPAIVAAVAE